MYKVFFFFRLRVVRSLAVFFFFSSVLGLSGPWLFFFFSINNKGNRPALMGQAVGSGAARKAKTAAEQEKP